MAIPINLIVYGNVFKDLACNGLKDLTDIFFKDIEVKLYKANNPSVYHKITSTDINGYYQFSNLNPGNYFIEIVPPSCYEFSKPNILGATINSNVDNLGKSVIFHLDYTNPVKIINAGLCKCLSISGKLFFDCNNDGILNNNEHPVSGVSVILYKPNSNISIASTVTDCNGDYSFQGLRPGNYVVTIIILPGMYMTTTNLINYYGSKFNSTGSASFTLTTSSILNGYGGFTGTTELFYKYCVNYNPKCCCDCKCCECCNPTTQLGQEVNYV